MLVVQRDLYLTSEQKIELQDALDNTNATHSFREERLDEVQQLLVVEWAAIQHEDAYILVNALCCSYLQILIIFLGSKNKIGQDVRPSGGPSIRPSV